MTGEHAYKFKKPVSLPFLDFSSLAHRKEACQNELRLNNRTAKSIYIGIAVLVDCSSFATAKERLRKVDSIASWKKIRIGKWMAMSSIIA